MVGWVATGTETAHPLFYFHLENLKMNTQRQTPTIPCSRAPSADPADAQRINNLFPTQQMC